MASFALEVKGWVEFEVERTFDDQDSAHRFGVERYSQNDWRIRHLGRDVLVYEYNPVQTIECAALLEINRFQRSEQWIRSMRERAEQAQIQRRRLASIASRQRQQQRPKKKKQQIMERINWMSEGF